MLVIDIRAIGNSIDIVKSLRIGKSAAKQPSNRLKVQRLGYGVLLKKQDGKTHECPVSNFKLDNDIVRYFIEI